MPFLTEGWMGSLARARSEVMRDWTVVLREASLAGAVLQPEAMTMRARARVGSRTLVARLVSDAEEWLRRIMVRPLSYCDYFT